MRCLTAPLLLAALVIFLAGCAGRDFVQPKPDAFVLGKTTYEEIIGQFGNPRTKDSPLDTKAFTGEFRADTLGADGWQSDGSGLHSSSSAAPMRYLMS